jgi:hypothetical protein
MIRALNLTPIEFEQAGELGRPRFQTRAFDFELEHFTGELMYLFTSGWC